MTTSGSVDEAVAALALEELTCQALDGSNRPGGMVSFEIVYRDPSTHTEQTLVVQKSVVVGRDPAEEGLQLSAGLPDMTISANAMRIIEEQGRVAVHNTSSYAALQISRASGALILSPGEALVLSESASVTVPGEVFEHEIRIVLSEAKHWAPEPIGTRSVLPEDYELPEERRETMAHLCAPLFYPRRFNLRQKAPEIARRISKSGQKVTAREINNKIQRTKDSIEEKCLTELETREDLARYLVEHGIITKTDVDENVLGPESSS